MFVERLTREQIKAVMNAISDEGEVVDMFITVHNSCEIEGKEVPAMVDVNVEFEEGEQSYTLYDYSISLGGTDFLYKSMMLKWFGDEYAIKFLLES